jgi:oxygen-dependent protoporphyrinogen oxidase
LTRAEVAIVGGGIAGLACAIELIESGQPDVVVLEAGARCGGPIESAWLGEWLIERGPTTVRSTPELARLFRSAGLEVLEGRRAAPWVVSGGRLVRVPPSPGQLLRGEWLPLPALLAAFCEPFRARGSSPRSVQEFVAERLGRELAPHVADLLTLGSFGAPAERVGFESAFPELARALERAAGRLSLLALQRVLARGRRVPRAPLISTREGLGALPRQLAARLGERLICGAPVRRIRRGPLAFELDWGVSGERRVEARAVVLAITPARLAPLLELAGTDALLEAFPSTPQTVVHLALEDAAAAQRWDGLGFLAPTREHLPLLGCLFPSQLFAGRAPRGTLLASVFVAPALRNASDLALVRELGPLLKRLLEAAREPTLLEVVRHPDGIPLYDTGHAARVHELRRLVASQPGLELAGWGFDGIGVGAAAASGMRAARALLRA